MADDRERETLNYGEDEPSEVQSSTLEFVGSEEQQSALLTALAVASAKIADVANTTQGMIGHRTFKYAPLDELVGACRPALAEQKAVILQFMHGPLPTGLQRVTTIVAGHGAQIRAHLDYKRHGDLKEWGKQTTYIRRYAYRSIFQLDGSDDADGDNGKTPSGEPQQSRQKPPSPPPARPKPAPRPAPESPPDEERAAIQEESREPEPPKAQPKAQPKVQDSDTQRLAKLIRHLGGKTRADAIRICSEFTKEPFMFVQDKDGNMTVNPTQAAQVKAGFWEKYGAEVYKDVLGELFDG